MTNKEIVEFLKSYNGIIVDKRFLVLFAITVLLGVYVALVYYVRKRREDYQNKTMVALILIPTVVAVIMLTMKVSLVMMLGMVGSLSIVRFRTDISNPDDSIYILWAVSIGVGAGAEYYIPILIGSVVLTMGIALLALFRDNTKTVLLELITDTALCGKICLDNREIRHRVSRKKLLSSVISDSEGRYVYNIRIKQSEDIEALLELIKKQNGVHNAIITL